MPMRYLTTDELLYLNGRALDDARLLAGEQKIREIDRLEAAVQRPAASAFGADAYPTLREKATVLLHSVARNHPFADGNKRTATLGLIFMLAVNGQCVAWDPAEALEAILLVATGSMAPSDFAQWLPLMDCEASPEADAEHDMARIDAIIDAQRWLLDQLAER